MIKTAELPVRTFQPQPARLRSLVGATLLAPLWATRRANMLWLLAMCGAISVGALAMALAVPGAKARVAAVFLYAMAAAFAWAFGFSGLLLLARDARAQAVPAVIGNVSLTACVYAVLTVALPTLAVAMAGGNPALAALVPAVATAAGLAFVLLPRWLAVWLSFLPAVYITLHQTYHLLSPFDPSFLRWGTLVLVVLVATDVTRWRRLLRQDANDTGRWGTPLLLQLRQKAVSRGWSIDKQLLWRRPESQHRFTNLHGIGPDTPVKAIEVALGAPFVPRTTAGNLHRIAGLAWPALVFGVAMGLNLIGSIHGVKRLLVVMAISTGMWAGIVGLVMLLVVVYAMLKRRWEHGAEPALLALLPGLGARAPTSRSVLYATCRKPALLCGFLWVLMLACEGLARLNFTALATTSLMMIGVCALTAVLLLRTFAGRAPGAVAQVSIAVAVFVLLCGSLALGFVNRAGALAPIWSLIDSALLASWLVVAVGMAWLAVRSWQQLARRPHPFLGGKQ